MKKKLTAEDWLDVALQVVAEDGVTALAVEPLSKRLGISKGSFYWHFKNRRALLLDLLEFWEKIEIDYQSRLIHEYKEPQKLLTNLLTLLIEDDTNKCVFLALSNELGDKDIRTTYEKAVERRIKMFSDVYVELGMDRKQSQKKAIVTFNLYLGLIKSYCDTPKKMSKYSGKSELMDEVMQIVLP